MRIRGFFVIQAALLFISIVRSAMHPEASEMTPLRHDAFLATCAVLSLIFVMAFITTRKPTTFRNSWAVAASSVSIVAGTYIVWIKHNHFTFASSAIAAIIVGLGGLYLYSQGGPAPRQKTAGLAMPQPESSHSA